MAAPGSGGRLVALPLAWLVGVALQLQQRDLWRLDTYLAIAAVAVAVALASARSRRAFAPLVVAALAAGFALPRAGLAMASIYDRLTDLDISLPPLAIPAGAYVPFVRSGKLVFLSGHIAKRDGKVWVGQLGRDMRTSASYAAWSPCGWNRPRTSPTTRALLTAFGPAPVVKTRPIRAIA